MTTAPCGTIDLWSDFCAPFSWSIRRCRQRCARACSRRCKCFRPFPSRQPRRRTRTFEVVGRKMSTPDKRDVKFRARAKGCKELITDYSPVEGMAHLKPATHHKPQGRTAPNVYTRFGEHQVAATNMRGTTWMPQRSAPTKVSGKVCKLRTWATCGRENVPENECIVNANDLSRLSGYRAERQRKRPRGLLSSHMTHAPDVVSSCPSSALIPRGKELNTFHPSRVSWRMFISCC